MALTAYWLRWIKRAVGGSTAVVFGQPYGADDMRPLPLTADGAKVRCEVAGVEIGDVHIEFPAEQTVNGTVAVSNFPATIEVSNFPPFPTFPASITVTSGGVTDAELRAAPLQVAGALDVEFPSTIEVSNFPPFPAPVTTVSVDNFPAPPAVQEVTGVIGAVCSGTVAVSNFPAFPATQAVSGTVNVGNFPATQAVSGTVNATCTGTLAVSNFPATQAVSLAACPLPAGASTEATLSTLSGRITACNTGAVVVSTCALPSGASTSILQTSGNASLTSLDSKVTACNTGAVVVSSSALPSGAATEATLAKIGQASTLCATATGISGAAVTLTIPAAGAGLFHYITHIRIQLYAAAARTGSATPIVVTTTNLPGAPAYTFETAQAIGTCVERTTDLNGNPMKSSAANTLSQIVCPVATTGIWRVTVHYYAGT